MRWCDQPARSVIADATAGHDLAAVEADLEVA
jgi:hypothetical protein